MSTPSFSRVTMQTVANYHIAARQMVAATGAGSRRAVGALDDVLRERVFARAARLAPQPLERVDALRGDVNGRVVQGIQQVEHFAEASIERSNRFACEQITRLADLAAAVEAPLVAGGLQTAVRLSLPAAQFALLVSSKVAEGATSLADVAGAHPVGRVVRKTAASAKRGAAKANAGARKTAARATKSPAAKRARRAVRQAAA